ncbi:MAG TPA: GumC family protein [Malonomonas sp.]
MVKTEDYTREFLRIFFSQKNLILFVTLFFTFCAVLIVLFWPSMYAADGSILVKGKRQVKSPDALGAEQARSSLLAVSKQDLASEVETIVSLDVLETTARNLNTGADDLELLKIINRLRRQLTIELVPSSNIINVRYHDPDPQKAVAVLRELFDNYLQYRLEIYNPVGIEVFFKTQALDFNQKSADLEQQLIGLSRRSGSPRPELEIESNLRSKKLLEQQLDELHSQQVEMSLQVANLQRDLASDDLHLFSYIQIQSINDLSEKIQSLVVEKAKLLSSYLPDSQKVKALDLQIHKAQTALKVEVSDFTRDRANRLDIVDQQIAIVEGRLADIVANNLALHEQQIEVQRIQRELALQTQYYEVFMKRWQEARINRSSDSNNLFDINILGRPVATGSPVYPKGGLLIPFAFLSGFITGCCLGFLREYFDQTFKNPDDVSRYTNLPTVISIPNWADANK